jgi:hypothetical protein
MESEEPRGLGIFLHISPSISTEVSKGKPPSTLIMCRQSLRYIVSDDLISSDLSIVTQVFDPHLDSLQIHATVLDE